jgi:hypothetical protein
MNAFSSAALDGANVKLVEFITVAGILILVSDAVGYPAMLGLVAVAMAIEMIDSALAQRRSSGS